MFGTNIFGSIFGQTSQLVFEESNYDIIYNDFGIKTDKIIINKFNWRNVGEIENNLYNIPRRDGKGFQSSFLRGKEIEISGYIMGATKEEMEQIINDLKTATSVPEKYLKFKNGDKFWKAKAVRTGLIFNEDSFTINYIPFTLNFRTLDAVWHEEDENVLFFPNKTSSFVAGFEYNGNSISYPKINIVFDTAIGVNSITIKINGVAINYEGSIFDLSIITFDGEKSSVLINGVKSIFTGTISGISPGYNTIEFIINGTFTSNISIINKVNYE